MTEQPPSASKEALELLEQLRRWLLVKGPTGNTSGFILPEAEAAALIDALIARWQHRDRQRLEQIATLQETVQSFQSAQAERPAPPAAVVDYTERARELWQDLLDKDDRTSPAEYPEMVLICFDEFRDYLSAVASEREAAAIRAFGQRVWSDTEEVAYQAGVSDTLARLREPEVREAVVAAFFDACHAYAGRPAGWDGAVPKEIAGLCAAAALTKIAEMLK